MPTAPSLTIGGATKLLKAGSLSISLVANGRGTAKFQIDSADASYRPALDAEVIITEGSTRIFGGFIDRPTEKGLFVNGAHAAIGTMVSASDFKGYADFRFPKETIPAGTTKAALLILVDYLDPYGVTLDAGQIDGPDLPDLEFDYTTKLSDIFNQICTLSAQTLDPPLVWTIDNFKVLSLKQPSTDAAPFDVVGDTPANVMGDIEIQKFRGSDYANRVIVKVPTKTEFNRVESFTGDGVTTTFTLQYTALKRPTIVLLSTGGGETIGTPSEGGGGQWSFDPTTNTIERLAGPTTNGTVYTVQFDGSFSGLGDAQDASFVTAPREVVLTIDSVPSDATAQSIAEAELAKRLPVMQTATYKTKTAGVLPGQQQTINVPKRNVNFPGVVSELTIKDLGKFDLQRTVTVIIDAAKTNIGRGFRDTYKVWGGDKTGSAIAAVVSSTTAPAPTAYGAAPPDKGIQVNRSGNFAASEEFTFDLDTDCLIAGADNSIDATNPDTCFLFGEDLHIEDA